MDKLTHADAESQRETPVPNGGGGGAADGPFDAATIHESDVLPPLAQAIDNLILARLDEQMAHHSLMEHDGGWFEEEGWVERTRAALANVVLKFPAPRPDAAAVNAEPPKERSPKPNGGVAAKFTPGSWLASKGDEDEPDRWVVVVDGPAQFFVAIIENGAPGDTLETEEANARLIAESPAMFNLLRQIVAEEKRLDESDDRDTGSLLALIRAASPILARASPPRS